MKRCDDCGKQLISDRVDWVVVGDKVYCITCHQKRAHKK